MSQLVACPECTKHLQVPDNLMGKKVQCPECKHTFVAQTPDEEDVPRTGLTSSKSQPQSAPAWDKKSSSSKKNRDDDDDDEDDDRKSRKKKRDRDDDDDDDRPRRRSKRSSSRGRGDYAPHRGGMILAFGLIGLIGGMAAFFPFVFGIMAWVMGNSDLEEMRAGRMDPEGEGMTNAGKILGMVAVILAIVSIVIACGFIAFWFLFVAVLFGGVAAAGAQQQNQRRF